MALDFFISTDAGVVFSFAWDVLAVDDVKGHRVRLLRHSHFSPKFRQLADLTRVTGVELSHDEIELLAREELYDPESRRAFVVSNSLQYGLGRMYQNYNATARNLVVFRDLDEAAQWIGVPLEVVNKAYECVRVARH